MLTFFVTGTVTSQSSMQQGRKCDVQGDEAVDLTVGDNFVYSDAQLGAFPQSIIVSITLMVHLNKGNYFKKSQR